MTPFPIYVFYFIQKISEFACKSFVTQLHSIGKREMDDKFMIEGGTELAPMSTTAQLWVALKYSQGGDSSVLLWLRTQNFMDRGVDLTWVSAFPHEREFLYSPLAYMRAVRDEPVVVQVGGVTYQVIEAKVQM